MDFALGYLGHRLLFRIQQSFLHWYVGGSRKFFAFGWRLLRRFNLLRRGRIGGVFLRLGFILLALFVYACVSVVLLFAYAVWVVLPPFLIFYGILGF